MRKVMYVAKSDKGDYYSKGGEWTKCIELAMRFYTDTEVAGYVGFPSRKNIVPVEVGFEVVKGSLKVFDVANPNEFGVLHLPHWMDVVEKY